MAAKREPKVRTTVTLPKPLYEEVRSVAADTAASSDSMNGFFVTAIRAYVKLLKRKQIDAQFRAMADDATYQKEAQLISEEFSQSDWEVLEKYAE